MSYNSKYTGQEVEDLLDHVANSNIGKEVYIGNDEPSDESVELWIDEDEDAPNVDGGTFVESDPIFYASPAAKITDEKIADWNSKASITQVEGLITQSITQVLNTEV